MKVACMNREGNPHIQTQLVKSLKSDILRQRHTVRNSLESTIVHEVRKHRVVDEHFDIRKQELVRAVDAAKRILEDTAPYYTQRGFFAMDMAYTKICHTLGEFERVVSKEAHELKLQDERMVSEVKVMENQMKLRQNEYLFFKGLYD